MFNSRNLAVVLLSAAFILSGCQPAGGPQLSALKDGGQWFLNNAIEGAFLHYEYDPRSKEWSDDRNEIREVASLWAITELYDFLEDERYLELEEQGFDYFEESFIAADDGDYHYLDTGLELPNLGSSSFVLMALLNSDHPERDYLAQQFADGIVQLQRSDGKISTYYFENRNSNQDYYPGEALLAMMEMYKETKDSTYLAVVEQGFDYYSDYWREERPTAMVPWHTQAYYEYYQVDPNDEMAEFVFEMNDYLIEKYSDDYCADFNFGSISTAVHMEGMAKAYALAKDRRDTGRSACYKQFVLEGMDHIIELQYPFGGVKVEETDPGFGGFATKRNLPTMRVDQNQHAVMAIIGAYEAGIY
jgi:hypothetical protein